MKVWLTRKHADRIDGIDLRRYAVGDTIELPRQEACLLLAERWAQPERRTTQGRQTRKRRRAADRGR
jgi:hypothetical protein